MENLPKLPPAIIPSQKIYYIDHVKILMTTLVIVHHVVITYGGPGDWYYRQPATGQVAVTLMTFFISTNQAFFMGLFFMLSAYFIEPSLKRKGTWNYLKDRLLRLGIPLLFYSFVLSPVMIYLVYHFGHKQPGTFLQFLAGFNNWINFGVLWYVAALLILTSIFAALYRLKLSGDTAIKKLTFGKVLFFAICLGAVTFLVRLLFPVGWVLQPLGFQLGHFPQYISMFTFGIMARRGNLGERLDLTLAKQFSWLAGALIIVVFPLLGYILSVTHAPGTSFNGGWNIESLVYSFYEQTLGISLMMAITGISRFYWNSSSGFLNTLSRSAFAAYIFHPIVVICLSLVVSSMNQPLLELAIVAPMAVATTFLLASGLVKVRLINNII